MHFSSVLWQCLLLAGWSFACTHAFAPVVPAPVSWGGLSARRFVLAPKPFPNTASAFVRPFDALSKLSIWDPSGTIASDEVPRYTAKPDRTITLDGTRFCVEAGDDNAVRINWCTGKPTQQWILVPWGSGRTKQIQLRGTSKCIDVDDTENGLNGAEVKLRECDQKVSEAWEFEEALTLPTPRSASPFTWRVLIDVRHIAISCAAMAALVALSLSSLLWRRPTKPGVLTVHQGGAPLKADMGGIALTVPLAVQPSRAKVSALQKQRGCSTSISMNASTLGYTYDPASVNSFSTRAASSNVGSRSSPVIMKAKGSGSGSRDATDFKLPPFNSYATERNMKIAFWGICAAALASLGMRLWRPESFLISRWLFLRSFAVVTCGAFLSARSQVLGLMGSKGLAPAADVLKSATLSDDFSQNKNVPFGARTILGDASDTRLKGICTAGAVAAITATLLDGTFLPLPGPLSLLPAACLLACHFLYRALTFVGDSWFRLQWDSLLQEASLIATFIALPPSLGLGVQARWLMQLLLFRLMLGSGLVKLASGDPSWRKLRAMDYHHLTQPLPARGARLAHLWQGRRVSTMSCVYTLLVELLFPFLIFLGPRMRLIGFALQASLQLGIAATGHYGFFNLLTLSMCVPLLSDIHLTWLPWPDNILFSSPLRYWLGPTSRVIQVCALVVTIPLAIAQAVGLSAAVQRRGPERLRLPTKMYQMHYWWQRNFSVGNSYGLFAVMTTKREEVVLEGTQDGRTWLPYGHRYKPDADLTRGLKNVPLMHMPRLDWWLWFVPLGSRGRWFGSLLWHLLNPAHDSPVLKLFDPDNMPFPDPENPPKAVRAVVAEYTWAKSESGSSSDASSGYWVRTAKPRILCGPFATGDASLESYATIR